MSAPLFYLFGYPGVGKNTVALEMERQGKNISAIHNHLLSNALRHVVTHLSPDDYARIAPELHHHTMKAWLNFLEFVEKAAPDRGLVFTSVLYQNEPDRVVFFEFIRNWAAQQGRAFYPVKLICDEQELVTRLQTENRKKSFKLTDATILHNLMQKNTLLQPDNCITLDITHMAPNESAAQILQHAGL